MATFKMTGFHPDREVSLETLLADNADDEGLCEWLKAAQVGESFHCGNWEDMSVERIA